MSKKKKKDLTFNEVIQKGYKSKDLRGRLMELIDAMEEVEGGEDDVTFFKKKASDKYQEVLNALGSFDEETT